jgi:hypothetical protein
MKWLLVSAVVALPLFAQIAPVSRVADDAIVIDRVAEASKRDLPRDLLKRIVAEDIEILRGKRSDGSYEFATWERFEGGRVTGSYSVQPRADKMATMELRGENVSRMLVDVPTRRLLVRKNRPVWLERVDVELVPEGSSTVQLQSFEVKAWLQPGELKPFDLPVIARKITAKVIATAEEKGGYGNIGVALVQARIVDNADSPYAGAVSAAKAIDRALDNNEIPSIRAMAQRLRSELGGSTATTPSRSAAAVVDVVAPRATSSPAGDAASRVEMRTELQLIEDLLTGSEAERREGLDRLHQLIRRLR